MTKSVRTTEEIGAALRKVFRSIFRGFLSGRLAQEVLHLVRMDQMNDFFELGMKGGRFSSALYLDTLENSERGFEYLQNLSHRLAKEYKQDIPSITTLEADMYWAASQSLRQILGIIAQIGSSTPVDANSIQKSIQKLKISSPKSPLFYDMLDALGRSAATQSEHVSGEPTDLEKALKLSNSTRPDHLKAINGSENVIRKLCFKWINEGKMLKEAIGLLDLYLEKVDILALFELLIEEAAGMDKKYFNGTDECDCDECDLRSFSSQLVRSALALKNDNNLPAYLPAKVIEFKDYVTDFTATKWTETFKKRLRRARAEAEKQRAAPGPLRLKEFILPVNDIDE